ncbi:MULTISPECIES: PASTA domain-containing protein [unclassified Streptococcus]|uniref:PASTA domain-containing protein n=1 Tax=unclassified Streptococcus TaxID=2608887 RepID=UPI001072AC76|nr:MULTISPECIES: PASTA domain-containing protein [unclassified Streptococcus]MBF0787436.1 PASTA domain-containing protein [Streptococcus sp. 19428wC2_LYSM12]MCQ9211739.1 PASTA domain-containing protein [Streptococcus sp. B01]MCQ9213072.1 PASTA domain-containing protein [Streptococcus sp. O1]TFV05656.1 PASTA domain-containing protein [Streptococcus sp. LYSM12]
MTKKKLPINGKTVGKVAKIFDMIPDTTRVIGEAVHAVVPLVDKVLEQNYQKKNRLVQLPNVVDMDIVEAQTHLEEQGFVVSKILAKPHQRYAKKQANEVVAMLPKSGNMEPGTLIKLYYVSQDVIEASDQTIVLPNLIGLPIEEAQEHLQELGLKPIVIALHAQARYANQQTNTVLDMQPKPNVLVSSVLKGSFVKLHYLTEAGLGESKTMAQKAATKRSTIPRLVKEIPKFLPIKKKK